MLETTSLPAANSITMACANLPGQRTRSRIRPFQLYQPRSIREALDIQASTDNSAAYLAGGLDLVNRMKDGSGASAIIHLSGIPELSVIGPVPDGSSSLRIGATATHHAAVSHALLRRLQPALLAVWETIGSPRVRFQGTLGGNLMACDAQYDFAPLLAAIGATGNVALPGGSLMTQPVGEPLPPGALLLSVDIPHERPIRLMCHRELKPVASVFVGIEQAGDVATSVRAAIGCAFATPVVRTLAAGLSLHRVRASADTLARQCVDSLPPALDDWRASGAFRTRTVHTVLKRLLAAAGGH